MPYAIQFNRKDAEGNKTLFPKNFVFAEVEYAADVDYQEEARQEGINPSGKYQHSLAGLKHLPTDGYYMYRTNPNPETDPWVITGAMKVNRILTRAEQAELVKNAGREPQQIQEGDIVTDDVVNSINQEIADAPKFSIKTYHGSQASFDKFDHSFMGSGEGAQAYGWGTYVSEVEGIAKAYAKSNATIHSDNGYKEALYKYREADFNYHITETSYKNAVKNLKEKEQLAHPKIKNLEKELDEAKSSGDTLSVGFLETALKNWNEVLQTARKEVSKYEDTILPNDKDVLEKAKKRMEELMPERNLYSVDIPDDTGDNYIGWDEPLTDKQVEMWKNAANSLAPKDDDGGWKERVDYYARRYGYNFRGEKAYKLLTSERTPKEVSLALKDAGFDGVKVVAQRNAGGNKEGKMNYVIFDENNAKITSHIKFSLRLKSAIEDTETNPSDAQKESGNYKKGHIKFGGYDYTIENPKGSTRSGKDANGKEWKVTMHDTYGYIRGKFGKDGDHLDMFINDKADLDNWDGDVFIVDQVNPDGSFDEHKVMYGYDSMDDAKKAYLANYSDGWKGLGNITGASKDEFDKWLDTSNRKLKPFKDYAKVKFSLKDIKPVGVGAFGNIYNQFRGKAKAAIEFLKKLGSGEATAALHHHTIGDISLVWGDKKTGLDKILRKHPEVVDNLQSIIDSMEVVQESDNRIKLESPTHFAVVSKEYKGEPREQWLLTAYEKRESLENGKSMDTATSSLGGDTALSQSKESAAKIDNSSEIAKENGEKFSLKDEKTMFGMHNISIDKLRKAIKQGGFAAPSMGVVDSKNGIYSDYGEITLIPKAEKLAKRTGKNAGTFTADAWTPTYPQVERIMNKQGEKAFNTDMNEKLGDVDNGIYSNIRESWKGYFSSGDVRDGLYWHYLFDKGMNPETIYQTGKYDNDITNEVMRISDNGSKTDYTDEEVAELIQLKNKATGEDNDVEAMREKLKARIASAEKKGNHLLAALKKKRLAELEGVENFYIAADFVNDVVRNNRKNGKVDVHDTMSVAKEKVENDKKLSADFPSWLDKKTEEYGVEEMLYNGTTPSGKPKYIPNTIDNAVKLMKKQGVAGGYTAFGSELGVFIAKNSPEVNTLDAMKNAKDKLIPFGDERHNQIKDKITKEFLELSDEIRVGSNNRYAFDDSGVSRMVELTDHKGNEKEYLKKAYNVEVSDEWMDRYNKLLDTIKKDYKVFYFETKFMRPYGLDEFEKAIVPSDTPSDVVDALKKAGIDVSSYERGNAEDRQKVTMDAINSSDNIRFSLKEEKEKIIADAKANGIPTQLTEHVIAPLLTGSDPKFSIRTYHGTGASFDKFDLSHALEGEGSESFGHGVYVTNSSKIGREYAQRAKNRKMEDLYKNMRYPDGVKGDIFKRRVFGEMVNDVATGGSVASAREFAKKRVGADANDIQRTLENLKDREKGTEYEQNLKDRLAEYKEGLKWIDSIDEDYLTQGNANRYDVDIPDDNGSNYLDWEGTIPGSLDKQKVAEDAYKVVSDNQGFNDFKATPLNDFIAHTLKTYVNTTDVAGRVEKLKSDIKDVIENYVADDDVLALNEYLKDATPDDVLATIWYNDLVRDIKGADLGEELYRKLSTYVGDNAASQILSDNGLVGIKYPAGLIHGGAKEGDYNYVIFDENNANIVGNTRFSLRYDKFEHDLNQWKKDNNLPKDAQRPTIPQRNAGESAVDFLRRVDEYRKQMALWKTAPTYEQHLLSDDTALGEFNRELQRGSVLKRIAFQDSMLAIRKAQEAIMKEVGVDRLNMAEDAYTAENRSHGKGKNEFEEYNNEFLQPLRKAYHQMKKVLGDSYDNVRVYMMAKHGLERDAQMAFKKSLEADYEDVNQRSAAYKAYKNDLDRVSNDADLEFGRVDFTTWRQKDNALRGKYSPSYMDYRYDDNGIAYDYSGLSSLFDGSDFEEAAHRLVRDVETKHLAEVQALWNATNAATKKILRDGFRAGMLSKDAYEYVKGMYSHYIPLRGWDGTTADQVWDYIGGGKGAFNQTLKKANGRTSIADDPIAYIENMAESGILLNNKNWVKQHLMLLAQNHPTSLLTLSKAWYVKSTDANGNEEWIPATPQITSQMNSNQVKAAIDAFEQKMEQMAQTGDATQQRDGLNIAYPQTHSEEREHEVRVMKDGEEYVIYVNGDPQLAQAMNNTRAHRVREIQSGKLDRAAAWLGRKMAAAYTSLSPLFIPSNYFRDLTMTLASTAIREDGRYNYLLRKNLATSWNLGFMLRDYQNGKLREKVSNGNATAKEQMFYDFMMNGGETGFVSSLDVEDLKKKFKNDLKDLDRWKANPVKVGHTIMDGIEFLNRAIEDSNRFAVYMTSIQYGRSIDEAVNDAKDVTLNFNRKGTGEYGWQMIRNLYLFINPAVQSLQTLGALTKHHPFKFTAVTAAWLASGVLVPIVNAALMSLLGGDDDKDKYWQFSKWDRRNNAIMWIPFTNEYVKIPLAQEFRSFYGIGEMIVSKMMGGELAEETWSQYAEDLLGQVVDMLPLDPTGYDGNIAVSLMPNPIRPVFELAFNVDFTGKPLFKDTEYNKYDPNFTKAYVGTPDWLVRVSKMVNSIGNDYPDVQQNAIDAFGDPRYNLNNPAVVDHVLSSYLGGAYTMGSQVLGVLTKSLNDPKEIKMADIPLVSKFVSNPDDRPVTKKQGDEFWNMKENHDRAANTLSKLKKQAKVDGDYSMLERFYGSEEYKLYKQEDVKVKKYEEDKKKERAEESGEEYRPHKLNAEDIYKAHATPKDDFEDLKLKQLFTKLNGFKTSYDLLVDTAPGQSDGYYNTNKVAIDAIDEISLDKQEISELKKGFLEDGKDAYNAEDMKRIRELRKRILSVLETANKVVVANQKAKAEKK